MKRLSNKMGCTLSVKLFWRKLTLYSWFISLLINTASLSIPFKHCSYFQENWCFTSIYVNPASNLTLFKHSSYFEENLCFTSIYVNLASNLILFKHSSYFEKIAFHFLFIFVLVNTVSFMDKYSLNLDRLRTFIRKYNGISNRLHDDFCRVRLC